jgi:F-type H+-transporting ATPase subunit epsilon
MDSMKNTFNLTIVTPEQVVQEGDITQATVPTEDGQITVMANHTPLVSLLAPGELRIKKPFNKDGETQEHMIPMAVSKGFIEVRQSGEVVILADAAQRAEHIDVQEAKEARKRANEKLKQKERESEEGHARAQANLQKELAKEKVAKKYQ